MRRKVGISILSFVLALALVAAAPPLIADVPVPTGLMSQCLPTSVHGLVSEEISAERVRRQKANRNTTFAAFSAVPYRLSILSFVYDREVAAGEAADEDEMNDAINEIMSAHPAAELSTRGTATLPISGVSTEAEVALFFWNSEGTEYGSFLWLVPRQTHYLKLRVTYTRPKGDQGKSMEFVRESTYSVARAICSAR